MTDMSPVPRLQLSAFLLGVATLGCPALVYGDGLAVNVEATVGETHTGLVDIGEKLTLIPLDAGSDTGEAEWLLRDSSHDNSRTDVFTSGHVGGLPGLDGLNTSPEAFRKALRGLDPGVVRAVLGQTDPAILMHITQGLSAPLPGLDTDGDGFSALPGLDGLPVHQSH